MSFGRFDRDLQSGWKGLKIPYSTSNVLFLHSSPCLGHTLLSGNGSTERQVSREVEGTTGKSERFTGEESLLGSSVGEQRVGD